MGKEIFSVCSPPSEFQCLFFLTFSGNRENTEPHLVKFAGRPERATPKSYIMWKLGRTPRAFDHHEWYVSTPEGKARRYVIDYYGVDDLTFSIDARPAIDDFQSLRARTLGILENAKGKWGENKKDNE